MVGHRYRTGGNNGEGAKKENKKEGKESEKDYRALKVEWREKLMETALSARLASPP